MSERPVITVEPASEVRDRAQLVKVPEAARITGLPSSLIRKSFIREDKRPKNVPSPPPHKRIGRSVFILADQLSAWVRGLESHTLANQTGGKRKRGRPTVAERIAQRQRKAV
jgi:hypothetical protein